MEFRNKQIVITKWQVIVFFMLIPSVLPDYLTHFSFFLQLCTLTRYVILIYLLINILYTWKWPSLMVWLILFSLIGELISTYLSPTGEFNDYIRSCVRTMETCLLFEWGIKKNSKDFIETFLFLLELWIFINLFTIILFPDGMYVSGSYSSNYFLGYHNTHIRWQIPALGISCIYSFINYKRLTFRTLFLYFVVLLSNFLVLSATSIIATFGFGAGIAYILFGARRGYQRGIKIFNIKSVLLIGIVGSIVVVGSTTTSSLVSFFTNLFGKSSTISGRTYIWENALELIKENPIWGYGYENADITSMKLVHTTGFGTSPHNFYLEILYQGGLVLITIMILIHFAMDRKLVKYIESTVSSIIGLWLVIIAFMGIVEPQYGIYLQVAWILAYNIDFIIGKDSEINIYAKMKRKIVWH